MVTMAAQGISRKFDAFIFDWDGTLNSPSIVNHPFWLRLKGSDMFPAIAVSEAELSSYEKHVFYGKARTDINKIENTAFVKMADLFFSLFKPRFHQGARELLERLNSDGKETALFTDGSLKRIFVEIKRLDAFKYFDIILSAQSIKRLKPDPAGLKIISRVLNVKETRCIYFGDRPEDIIAAKKAGMGSAAMLNGFAPKSALLDSEPDFSFGSMEEVLKAL